MKAIKSSRKIIFRASCVEICEEWTITIGNLLDEIDSKQSLTSEPTQHNHKLFEYLSIGRSVRFAEENFDQTPSESIGEPSTCDGKSNSGTDDLSRSIKSGKWKHLKEKLKIGRQKCGKSSELMLRSEILPSSNKINKSFSDTTPLNIPSNELASPQERDNDQHSMMEIPQPSFTTTNLIASKLKQLKLLSKHVCSMHHNTFESLKFLQDKQLVQLSNILNVFTYHCEIEQ